MTRNLSIIESGRRSSPATGSAGRRLVLCALAATLSLAVAAPSAAAFPPSFPDTPGWVTDGSVNAIARSDSRTFIGGDFTRVGPRTGAGAQLHGTTAARTQGLPEVFGGEIRAVTGDGAGGWFIGGTFTHVGGVARAKIARIKSPSGVLALDDAWNPGVTAGVTGAVNALKLHEFGGKKYLYVAGDFTHVGGQTREHLAALDVTGGEQSVTAWYPKPNQRVHALDATNVDVTVSGNPPSAPLVFVGGEFTTVQGATATITANRLVALWGAGAKNSAGLDRTNADTSTQWFAAQAGITGTVVWSVAVGTPDTADVAVRSIPVYAAGNLDSTAGGDFLAYRFQVTRSTHATTQNAYANWSLPNVPCTNCAPSQAFVVRVRRYVGDARDTVFVGGKFTALTGSGTDLTRHNVAALFGVNSTTDHSSTTKNAPTKAWDPGAIQSTNGPVQTFVVSSDGSTLFAGGDFTQAGGQTRDRLAAHDAASGLARSEWAPTRSGGEVSALAAQDNFVYVGGTFNSIGSGEGAAGGPQVRNGLAAFDGNQLASWNPSVGCVVGESCSAQVGALATAGGKLYLGGTFTAVNGEERRRLASVDLNGSIGPHTPVTSTSGATGVMALESTGDTIYVGGLFTHIAGQPRGNLAALDAEQGTVKAGWGPGTSRDGDPTAGNVYALDASCATVLVGGRFDRLAGAERDRLGAVDVVTGQLRAWNPGAYGTQGTAVHTVVRDGDRVYAGGEALSQIGGASSAQNIAALDATTGQATSWRPRFTNMDAAVRAIVPSPDSSTVYVGGANFGVEGVAGAKTFESERLAAFSASSGDLLPWYPSAPDPVNALLPAGGGVMVGGDFKSLGVPSTSHQLPDTPTGQQGFASFGGALDSFGTRQVNCGGRTTATSGGPAAATEVAQALVQPPVRGPGVRNFRITKRKLVVGKEATPLTEPKGKKRRRMKTRTAFRYSLTKKATVRITIRRKLTGLRVGRSCLKSTRDLRGAKPRLKRCTRYVRIGGILVRNGKRGRNVTQFSGRVGKRALKRGDYRATIIAYDDRGKKSRPRHTKFTVVGAKR